ncbi:hypothetical protein BCR41DRAFT_296732, partial [Lobosporangium transversale]
APYKDVWPTTIALKDGYRLVIGTQTFNVLVTSSIRLKIKELPSLGGIATLFTIRDNQSSRDSK